MNEIQRLSTGGTIVLDRHGIALAVIVIRQLVVLVIMAVKKGNIHCLCGLADNLIPLIGMAIVATVVQQRHM